MRSKGERRTRNDVQLTDRGWGDPEPEDQVGSSGRWASARLVRVGHRPHRLAVGAGKRPMSSLQPESALPGVDCERIQLRRSVQWRGNLVAQSHVWAQACNRCSASLEYAAQRDVAYR